MSRKRPNGGSHIRLGEVYKVMTPEERRAAAGLPEVTNTVTPEEVAAAYNRMEVRTSGITREYELNGPSDELDAALARTLLPSATPPAEPAAQPDPAAPPGPQATKASAAVPGTPAAVAKATGDTKEGAGTQAATVGGGEGGAEQPSFAFATGNTGGGGDGDGGGVGGGGVPTFGFATPAASSTPATSTANPTGATTNNGDRDSTAVGAGNCNPDSSDASLGAFNVKRTRDQDDHTPEEVPTTFFKVMTPEERRRLAGLPVVTEKVSAAVVEVVYGGWRDTMLNEDGSRDRGREEDLVNRVLAFTQSQSVIGTAMDPRVRQTAATSQPSFTGFAPTPSPGGFGSQPASPAGPTTATSATGHSGSAGFGPAQPSANDNNTSNTNITNGTNTNTNNNNELSFDSFTGSPNNNSVGGFGPGTPVVTPVPQLPSTVVFGDSTTSSQGGSPASFSFGDVPASGFGVGVGVSSPASGSGGGFGFGGGGDSSFGGFGGGRSGADPFSPPPSFGSSFSPGNNNNNSNNYNNTGTGNGSFSFGAPTSNLSFDSFANANNSGGSGGGGGGFGVSADAAVVGVEPSESAPAAPAGSPSPSVGFGVPTTSGGFGSSGAGGGSSGSGGFASGVTPTTGAAPANPARAARQAGRAKGRTQVNGPRPADPPPTPAEVEVYVTESEAAAARDAQINAEKRTTADAALKRLQGDTTWQLTHTAFLSLMTSADDVSEGCRCLIAELAKVDCTSPTVVTLLEGASQEVKDMYFRLRDDFGRYPLYMVFEAWMTTVNMRPLLDCMLDQGAPVDWPEDDPPLKRALDYRVGVNELLSHGAQLYTPSFNALHHMVKSDCAREGSMAIFRRLLKLPGADTALRTPIADVEAVPLEYCIHRFEKLALEIVDHDDSLLMMSVDDVPLLVGLVRRYGVTNAVENLLLATGNPVELVRDLTDMLGEREDLAMCAQSLVGRDMYYQQLTERAAPHFSAELYTMLQLIVACRLEPQHSAPTEIVDYVWILHHIPPELLICIATLSGVDVMRGAAYREPTMAVPQRRDLVSVNKAIEVAMWEQPKSIQRNMIKRAMTMAMASGGISLRESLISAYEAKLQLSCASGMSNLVHAVKVIAVSAVEQAAGTTLDKISFSGEKGSSSSASVNFHSREQVVGVLKDIVDGLTPVYSKLVSLPTHRAAGIVADWLAIEYGCGSSSSSSSSGGGGGGGGGGGDVAAETSPLNVGQRVPLAEYASERASVAVDQDEANEFLMMGLSIDPIEWPIEWVPWRVAE